jgi:hypothetical protein
MTYFPMGDISTSDFNSTKYPGVCKPSNFATLAVFKELQYQLNRLAQGLNMPKIAVDGDIGPGTIKLVSAIGAQRLLVDASTCVSIATKADTLTSVAKQQATALGVPDKISAPSPPQTPSIITPAGAIVPQPAAASLSDAFRNMGTPTLIALGVGVVAVGYVVAKDMKKKGRK